MANAQTVLLQRQKLAPLMEMAQHYAGMDLSGEPEEFQASVLALQENACKIAQDIAEIALHIHDLDNATALLQDVLTIKVNAATHRRLADIWQLKGDWWQAANHYRQAEKAGEHGAEFYKALAHCLTKIGNATEAAQAFENVLEIEPDQIDALNALTFHALKSGAFDKGLALAIRAVDAAPDNAAAQFNLGQTLQGLGRMHAAKAAYEAVLRIDPRHVDAYLLLGMLTTFTADDPRLQAMQSLHQALAAEPARRLKIGFALYKAMNDAKLYDAAFAYLEDANNLRRAQFSTYSVDDDIDLMEALAQLFTPELIHSAEQLGNRVERPVFIVGLPRSGTSLTEQILASHPQIYGAGELETLSYKIIEHFFEQDRKTLKGAGCLTPDSILDAAQGYIAPVRAKVDDNRRIVDKMPVNFLWIGFIKLMFPLAKIIIMRRDPIANGFALYSSYFPSDGMQYSYNLSETARYIAAERKLTAHWAALFPHDVLELSYERLTEEQEAQTRRLLDFCDLPWDERCLDFNKTDRPVMTLSVAQVRKGLYSGVDKKTAHYRHHLGEMIAGLAQAGLVSADQPEAQP
ncbi:sulfotransferase [Rhizobium sp.]|jgi:tetratricopeptide (TPR) repeat protein|uniref:tetratricopeptide repeat-containing sulfotransferase family protein n=1 Tax=Rhizobium sp. TaxID=391 RepID=UPI000E97AF6A|nr:hypothetical protein [Rhizobium sp.]